MPDINIDDIKRHYDKHADEIKKTGLFISFQQPEITDESATMSWTLLNDPLITLELRIFGPPSRILDCDSHAFTLHDTASGATIPAQRLFDAAKGYERPRIITDRNYDNDVPAPGGSLDLRLMPLTRQQQALRSMGLPFTSRFRCEKNLYATEAQYAAKAETNTRWARIYAFADPYARATDVRVEYHNPLTERMAVNLPDGAETTHAGKRVHMTIPFDDAMRFDIDMLAPEHLETRSQR